MEAAKHKLYIKVPYLKRGKLAYKKVQNIGRVKGVFTFKLDQQYAFQCAPLAEGEESITVIRMTIPKGTPVTQGYTEVCQSLAKMGYDPVVVCTAMGFDEVLEGAVVAILADTIQGYKADLLIMDDIGCPA